MKISVIIPTRDRQEVLAECLRGYAAQDYGGEFELLVVDDGSAAGAQAEKAPAGLPVKYLRQPARGPAAARNLGIREATGDLLLFTGDDMLPEKGLLAAHAAFHAARPGSETAMLGRAAWDPRVRPSPFARWLEAGGPQFGFGKFSPGQRVSAFWTANLSVKKSFLLSHGVFDEDFAHAAGEDVELGTRLQAAGLEIIYNPEASVRHFHRVTFAAYCRRQELAGRAHALFLSKHPEQAGPAAAAAPPWKALMASASPALRYLIDLSDRAGIELDPRWYDLVLSYYFRRGLLAGA
ncbi:MAG: glycosyltransferase [Elusimicrobiales bacterium]|nr:glycosyltransferase [Elusimicrobiales bacterium]